MPRSPTASIAAVAWRWPFPPQAYPAGLALRSTGSAVRYQWQRLFWSTPRAPAYDLVHSHQHTDGAEHYEPSLPRPHTSRSRRLRPPCLQPAPTFSRHLSLPSLAFRPCSLLSVCHLDGCDLRPPQIPFRLHPLRKPPLALLPLLAHFPRPVYSLLIPVCAPLRPLDNG